MSIVGITAQRLINTLVFEGDIVNILIKELALDPELKFVIKMIFFYPIFKMLDRLEKKKNFLFYYSLFNDIIFIMLDVSLLYFGDKVECFNYHVLNDSLFQTINLAYNKNRNLN
jgi:hypothetical protein